MLKSFPHLMKNIKVILVPQKEMFYYLPTVFLSDI